MPTDGLDPENTDDIEALLLKNLPSVFEALGLGEVPAADGTLKGADSAPATPAPPVDLSSQTTIQDGVHQQPRTGQRTPSHNESVGLVMAFFFLSIPVAYEWLDESGPSYPDKREALADGDESLRIPLLLKHDLVEVTSYYHDGVAESLEFGGYPCTDDCTGHIAGYDWAEEQGITDPAECTGDSDSFTEGCLAWTEEPDQRP